MATIKIRLVTHQSCGECVANVGQLPNGGLLVGQVLHKGLYGITLQSLDKRSERQAFVAN
jgi:hypothetical protein